MWKTNQLFVLFISIFMLTIKISRCEIYSTLVDRPGGVDPILDCKGWVTLLSIKNSNKIIVEARKLQKRIRSISKNKIVKKKIHVRGMRFATVNGECCWEVRRNYHGGETKELWRAHTYYTPWSIRAISLIKC